MIDQHDHWNDFVEWFHEHWPLLSGIAATIAGTVWMFLHKTFPTHEKLDMCKKDLTDALQLHEDWEAKQHTQHRSENAAQHAILHDEIADVRNVVGHVRSEISELKNILLQLSTKGRL